MQLLSGTRQNSVEFIFRQDCHSAHDTLVLGPDINISQGSVATHFRCGGTFNDRFIIHFQEIVKLKEF